MDRQRLPSEIPKKLGPPRRPRDGGGHWRAFEDARKFVRSLGIKSKEGWDEFVRSGDRPDDIPRSPHAVYRYQWRGYGDWLGTGRLRGAAWRPFGDVKKFARSLGIKTSGEWEEYAKSGNKPEDIPIHLNRVYKEAWCGWRDFLGTGFRPFEAGREFARSLGLKTTAEWVEYCKSGDKPEDIPSAPEQFYKDQWRGMRDWLGAETLPVGKHQVRQLRKNYRSFEEARTHARGLGLKSRAEWDEYGKSGQKPDDIPQAADAYYKHQGWQGWGDFLATGNRRPGYEVWRAFEEAREFARTLGITGQKEWRAYAKSEEKPKDIPGRPDHVYAEVGWQGWGDWLGTGYRQPKKDRWRLFEEARAYVHSLGLKSKAEWREYCKSGQKPDDIPAGPHRTYKDSGWAGYGDWLGTGSISNRGRFLRPFKEAREFARSLDLKSGEEWQRYSKSGERPADIPGDPTKAYKGSGWQGWGDWLGTGNTQKGSEEWRPFEEARAYVRSLGLKGQKGWDAFAQSEERPADIPKTPWVVYKNEGWLSLGDWLGTGRISTRTEEWRPFEEAREFVRGLGLASVDEWKEYARSPNKPRDIPQTPNKIYEDAGWEGYPDWLGAGRAVGKWRPYEEARAYIRSLGIKDKEEWQEYCRSGKKPYDIPSTPDRIYNPEWRRKHRNEWNGNIDAGTEEQGVWRGWADWLGIVNQWNRNALIAFLEDLRPHLESLEEKELYAIIAQSGAMPALRGAFDKERPGRLIQDLKENDGREIEAAILGTTEEELEEAALSGEEATEEETLGLGRVESEISPPEEYLEDGEVPQEDALPSLATSEGLRAVDALSELHYGLDDETATFLVRNRVAALWDAYINSGAAPVEDALSGEGGHYFGLIRARFYEELRAVQNLPIPAGWSFRPPGVGYENPPAPPNLMQKRTAYEVRTRKRVGNWSSVGTGKTLSGILASRVSGRRHTLIICNKATVDGWRAEILNAFPDSVVRTSVANLPTAPLDYGHHYTILNYDKFQLPSRLELIRRLADAGTDFVIFDEVQFVKQRDSKASIRRKAVEGLTSLLSEHIGDDLHVLGMSATPVINNLLEARKLLEVVQGRSFADLGTQATAANALATHRALMVYGFRYRAPYEAEMNFETLPVLGNGLLGELREAATVLEVEQVLLQAKLEAVRDYIRPGALIYSYYVDEMVEPIRRFVERLGYRVGMYIGSDKSGYEDFLAGRVDVLVGSKPVGTGLDGLQRVCDRIVELSPPWTSADQEQLEGRIRRQGSAFERVSVIVPQVVLEHDGDEWSWDKRRWKAIEYKRTLSDCAVDGRIPETARMSPERLLAKSREALEEWIARVGGEDLNLSEIRPHLRVPLPPETTRKLVVSRGDFATLNNRWASSNSQTVHIRLQEDPAEWYLYHTLYREARESWSEVPALRIAEDLKARSDLRVGDFGAGECLLRDALPNHDVVSLDHVAVDEGVIACDVTSTPLKDGVLGAAVFSLSLMGRNWRDYLAEAHRTLQPFGLLFIAETAKKWEGREDLEEAVRAAGFELLPTTPRGDFLYLRGIKV